MSSVFAASANQVTFFSVRANKLSYSGKQVLRTQVHNRVVVPTKIEQRLPAYSSNQSLHFFTENGFVISSLL